ncbi:camphor resistance CrcB family protein isoform X2 [Wolffia australiana]
MANCENTGDQSDRRLPARSMSMCARFESQTVNFPSVGNDFWRSSSSRDPWRRYSLSGLSREGSRRSFEGVPSEVLCRTHPGSHWKEEDEALENEENRFCAQVGDSGDQVVGEREEEGVLVEENTVSVSEKGTSDSIIYSKEEKISTLVVQPLERYKLPLALDYASYMLHMAVFGILGVFARHLLQKLFGPDYLALTRDGTPLYLDLPANMVGSFFMGWFGLVFKGDVRHVSDHLAVGLTTGFMGSLTTFSGWNQKMLILSSQHYWVFAIAGFILGFFLVNESFNYGVASAEYLRRSLPISSLEKWALHRPAQHAAAMAIAALLLFSLLALSAAMAKVNEASLWVACLVAPPGVWLRWYLARFNGRGFGKKAALNWLPLGTLAANLLAAIAMAALSTISHEKSPCINSRAQKDAVQR